MKSGECFQVVMNVFSPDFPAKVRVAAEKRAENRKRKLRSAAEENNNDPEEDTQQTDELTVKKPAEVDILDKLITFTRR